MTKRSLLFIWWHECNWVLGISLSVELTKRSLLFIWWPECNWVLGISLSVEMTKRSLLFIWWPVCNWVLGISLSVEMTKRSLLFIWWPECNWVLGISLSVEMTKRSLLFIWWPLCNWYWVSSNTYFDDILKYKIDVLIVMVLIETYYRSQYSLLLSDRNGTHWVFRSKNSLKIAKGGNPYIEEEQTTMAKIKKIHKDKQRSTKHTHKTKDLVTRTPLKTGWTPGAPEG